MSGRRTGLLGRAPTAGALFAALLGLTVLACGDSAGPLVSGAGDGYGTLLVTAQAQELAVLPAALEPATLQALVSSADGMEVVKDTTLAVTPGQQLALELPVEVEGPDQPFLLELLIRTAEGVLVYQVGPIPVVARLLGSGGSAQEVTLTYVGPGADAQSLEIVPGESRVVSGETVSLDARARSGTGGDLGSTPVEWSTLDPDLVVLEDEATGRWRGLELRGVARVVAELEPVGLADTALIRVVPRAAELVAVSGNGQMGGAGVPLPQPVIVRVLGTDGLPVEGEEISFAPAQDGVAEPETAVSDAEGLASASWTPGPLVGTQTLTASVAADPELAVSFSAEVGPAPLARIILTPEEILFSSLTATRRLTAEGRDGFGNLVELESVLWTSSAPGIARVNQNGGVTSEPARITVSQVPVTAVLAPGSGWTLTLGQNLQFTAVARDSLERPVSGATFGWSSSNPAVAPVNATGSVQGLAPGNATIRARLLSDTLIQAQSSGTVVDPPNPPSGVTVVPNEGEGGELFSYTVRWVDNSPDETRFQVERSLNAGATWQVAGNAELGATSFFDSGPPNGWPNDRRVLHRVRACRGEACSPPATSTAIEYTQPNAPGNVTATLNGETFDVSTTWNDPNSFEGGYEVQLWEVCFSDNLVASVVLPPNATSYTFEDVNGTQFQARVRGLGQGPFDSGETRSNVTGGICIGQQ